MKQFTSHIDYLLQKHDCVIIPDFGGFVLNREKAFIIPDGAIRPPYVIVGFNPELKHNDGLLAESYMNVYNISYDAACKKVKESVTKLNDALLLGQSLQIGRIGRIKLDENKQLCFMPNNYLSLYYPETFGLSLARVRPLADIDPDYGLDKEKRNKISFKNIVTGAVAAAAAILIFFVSSTPIDQNSQKQIQQSSFFPEINIQTPSFNSILNKTREEKQGSEAKEISSVKPSFDNQQGEVLNTERTATNNDDLITATYVDPYYIVIGSANSKSEAEKALTRLKSQGYISSKVLSLGKDRYRIYVSSFRNKDEAMTYLVNFKKENPKNSDAWLYEMKSRS